MWHGFGVSAVTCKGGVKHRVHLAWLVLPCQEVDAEVLDAHRQKVLLEVDKGEGLLGVYYRPVMSTSRREKRRAESGQPTMEGHAGPGPPVR